MTYDGNRKTIKGMKGQWTLHMVDRSSSNAITTSVGFDLVEKPGACEGSYDSQVTIVNQ